MPTRVTSLLGCRFKHQVMIQTHSLNTGVRQNYSFQNTVRLLKGNI